jgi:hypothetical protein
MVRKTSDGRREFEMKKLIALILVSPLVASTLACEVSKSENPLSPSVAGPIPGVGISAPSPLEPRDGINISVEQQPVTLTLENASTNGVRPLSYIFEVATDVDFSNKVFVREGVGNGDGGRTALRLPDPLATARTYYWRARAGDGANTGPFSGPAHFNIFTPIVIDRPTPRSPVNNVRISSLQPQFSIGNAPRSGPVGAISYELELADGDSFGNKISVWTFAEQPGQTNFNAPHGLVHNKQYFWHVRAYDGKAVGPWSDTQVFLTPIPPPPPPQTPTPPSSPGAACGPPYPNQPFGIVQCRRSQYGRMSSADLVNFLRGVARDLNSAGIAGGPFGILRKRNGANCGGYSCDIICAGQGSGQRQWDVLGDSDGAQTPAWIGPHTGSRIRVDTCEIQ